VPQALCIVYATLIWSTREVEVALMFAGQLGCEAVNFALKRLIKEERPRRIHLDSKGYGMPSSHAQFAFFWATALSLFLMVRHRPRRPAGQSKNTKTQQQSASQSLSVAERAATSLLALVVACMIAWSRIYLGYHTPKQVLVGCAAGTVTAFAWFGVTYVVRQVGLLAWALDIPLARWLRFRDLVVEEDLCQAGWEKWEGIRAAKRDKKKAT
jgi:dolichyldiphosphatase